MHCLVLFTRFLDNYAEKIVISKQAEVIDLSVNYRLIKKY